MNMALRKKEVMLPSKPGKASGNGIRTETDGRFKFPVII